jgi:hypothetical protein
MLYQRNSADIYDLNPTSRDSMGVIDSAVDIRQCGRGMDLREIMMRIVRVKKPYTRIPMILRPLGPMGCLIAALILQ